MKLSMVILACYSPKLLYIATNGQCVISHQLPLYIKEHIKRPANEDDNITFFLQHLVLKSALCRPKELDQGSLLLMFFKQDLSHYAPNVLQTRALYRKILVAKLAMGIPKVQKDVWGNELLINLLFYNGDRYHILDVI